MTIIAEIVSGEHDTADVLLLIAVILIIVDLLLTWVGQMPDRLKLHLAAIGLIALALMVQ